jgi:hypothetical protein
MAVKTITLTAHYYSTWYRDYPISVTMSIDCDDYPSTPPIPTGTSPAFVAPLD